MTKPLLSRVSGLPKYLNPVLRPIARRAPPMAVIHHQGRTSGKPFDTPVQAFRTKTGFIVGLAYHSNPNWAQNILAADGGEMSRGGHRYTLTQPRKRGAEARNDLPAAIGFTMRKLRIDDFLEFDATRI
jgi:deazaflavin-dependent oxidoreductase (nitroreductase family)